MATWPVEVRPRHVEVATPVDPGDTVIIQRVNDHGARSYVVQCPRCGVSGYCEHGKWAFTGGEDNLTARPSILCSCGGHYWLTDGVLTEC